MRNTKFLVLALAIAVMLMGAGYAAWTDGFSTTTTINTGNLEVTLNQAKTGVSYHLFKGADLENLKEYDNISFTHPETEDVIVATDDYEQALNITFNNIYPGVAAQQKLWVSNDGTLPAAIQNVTTTIEKKAADGEWVEYSPVGALGEELDKITVRTKYVIKDKDGIQRGDTFIKNDVKLTQLAQTLSEAFEGQYLLPGEVLTGDEELTEGERLDAYFMEFAFPETMGNASENSGLRIKIDYDFVQYNVFDEENNTQY